MDSPVCWPGVLHRVRDNAVIHLLLATSGYLACMPQRVKTRHVTHRWIQLKFSTSSCLQRQLEIPTTLCDCDVHILRINQLHALLKDCSSKRM